MSILDQLFPSKSQDPSKNAVQVTQLRPQDWIMATTSLAAHQAMNDGFRPGSRNIDTSLGRPNYQVEGTINVAQSLAVSLNYRRLLVQEQLKDIRFKPTADDVVDGGIKNGAKVVIKVVPEDQGQFDSWNSLVRANIEDTDGTPRDLTFDKFSVMSITEPDEVRYQLHETFGADIIQTFGRRPRIVTMSGQVVNGKLDVNIGGEIRSMDWKNAFQRYYDKHYSAHACTRKRKKIRIFAQDTVYEGYIINMVSAVTAMDQGIAQVTITFIVANRNFPRENDDKIPGFGSKNGFVLTGKTTPDDYFPQPRVESYFQNDFSRVIQVALFDNRREQDLLINKLATLSASDQIDGLQTDQIYTNLSSFYGKISDGSEHLFSPIKGSKFRLHELLQDTDIHKSLIAFGQAEQVLTSKRETFNLSLSGDPNSSEVVNVNFNDNAVKYLEYASLKNEESYIRTLDKGLAERVSKLNKLALELESLIREESNLNDLNYQIDDQKQKDAEIQADADAALAEAVGQANIA